MSGRDFETEYQALRSCVDDEDTEFPPTENIVHVVPDKNRGMSQYKINHNTGINTKNNTCIQSYYVKFTCLGYYNELNIHKQELTELGEAWISHSSAILHWFNCMNVHVSDMQ